MSTSPNSQEKERPSTYAVQDRNNEEELQRLTVQDQAITQQMGGPLSEQTTPERFTTVLDVGCATGGWAIELAQQYPWMQVTGIDISERMIQYARQQAEQAKVADRVHFHVMDALTDLTLPTHSYDLVNERYNFSYIRTWEWPNYLLGLQRVTRPGGVVRLTEGEISRSTSPAFAQLFKMIICACFKANYYFEPEADGIVAHLEPMLQDPRYQFHDIQHHVYERDLPLNAPDPSVESSVLDALLAVRTMQPFFRRTGCMVEDYDSLYERMQAECQQDYRLSWRFVTFWATTPDQSLRSPTRQRATLPSAPLPTGKEATGTSIIRTLLEHEPERLKAFHTLMPKEYEGLDPKATLSTDLTQVRLALDVDSGAGDWALSLAQDFPQLAVAGIDLSTRLTTVAQARAQQAGLSERAHFYQMDALSRLHFEADSFDLVHLREASSFVRQWEWTPLLAELLRVMRPGGLFCFTEVERALESSSAALVRFSTWLRETLFRRQYLFQPDAQGFPDEFTTLLERRDVTLLTRQEQTMEYQAGTSEGQAAITYIRLCLPALRPFLAPNNARMTEYAALSQQVLADLEDEHFWMRWTVQTLWAMKQSSSVWYPRSETH